jgi:hypothetical protein
MRAKRTNRVRNVVREFGQAFWQAFWREFWWVRDAVHEGFCDVRRDLSPQRRWWGYGFVIHCEFK